MLHFPVEKTSHTSLAPIIDVAKNTELGARVADWLLLHYSPFSRVVFETGRGGGFGDLSIHYPIDDGTRAGISSSFQPLCAGNGVTRET
jgi:hypothetical protein